VHAEYVLVGGRLGPQEVLRFGQLFAEQRLANQPIFLGRENVRAEIADRSGRDKRA